MYCGCENEVEAWCERQCTGADKACGTEGCTWKCLCGCCDKMGCVGLMRTETRRWFIVIDLVLLLAAMVMSCLGLFGLSSGQVQMMGVGAWMRVDSQRPYTFAVGQSQSDLRIFGNLYGLMVMPINTGDADFCSVDHETKWLCDGKSWVDIADTWENDLNGSSTMMGNLTLGEVAYHCKAGARKSRLTLVSSGALSVLLLLARATPIHHRLYRQRDYRKKCTLLLCNLVLVASTFGTLYYFYHSCIREMNFALDALTWEAPEASFRGANVQWQLGFDFMMIAWSCYLTSCILQFSLKGGEETPKETAPLMPHKQVGPGPWQGYNSRGVGTGENHWQR